MPLPQICLYVGWNKEKGELTEEQKDLFISNLSNIHDGLFNVTYCYECVSERVSWQLTQAQDSIAKAIKLLEKNK